jgi:VCBS repeat-containing protein
MATFTVTTRTDEIAETATLPSEAGDGTGLSLREAIALANATAEADIILFDASVFATGNPLDLRIDILNNTGFGELVVTAPVTIDGSVGTLEAPLSVLLEADPDIRILRIEEDADTILRRLDMRDGSPRDGEGGGAILSFSDLELDRVTVTGARTTDAGAAGGAVRVQGALTVSGGSFTDNGTTGGNAPGGEVAAGGALYATGRVQIDGADFADNFTTRDDAAGGAVYAGGILSITGGSFTGNGTAGANAPGGAVFAAAGATIEDASFEGNRTGTARPGDANSGDGAGGGAVFAVGNLTISGSSFSANRTAGAEAPGGAAAATGPLSVSTSSFADNETTGPDSPGGALSGPSASVTSSALTGNATAGSGSGGGALSVSGLAALSSVEVSGNSTLGSEAPGGAVLAGSVTLVSTSAPFADNATVGADSPGGAIAAILAASVPGASGTIAISGASFSGNATAGHDAPGGTLYATGPASVAQSVIEDGTTTGVGSGGGGLSAAGKVTVNDSTFRGNRTEGDASPGGGIHALGEVDILERSTLQGNATEGRVAPGGGISAAGRVVVRDSTVSDNETLAEDSPGGGIHAAQALTMLSATLSGNATGGVRSPGGGAFAGGTATLSNATLASNRTDGSDSSGGGIHAATALNLLKSTVTGNITTGANAPGGGLFAGTSRLVGDSIVLGNAVTGSSADTVETAYGSGVLLSALGTNILSAQDALAERVFEQTFVLVGEIRAGVLAQNDGQVATVRLDQQNTNPAIDVGLVELLDEVALGLDLNGDGAISGVIRTDARGGSFLGDVDLPSTGNDGADFGDIGAFEATVANRAPTAVPDQRDVSEDAPSAGITVVLNDTDPDPGTVLTVSAIDTTDLVGTAMIDPDGQRNTYFPMGLFNSLGVGQVSQQIVRYTVTDGDGGFSDSFVQFDVIGSNDPPVAVDDTGETGAQAGEVAFAVLENDTDADLIDDLSITALQTTATLGSARISADGLRVLYDPAGAFDDLEPGETASDQVVYIVTDGNGGAAQATLSLTIRGEDFVNSPPVAVDDVVVGRQGAVLLFDPLADNGAGPDSDPDGQTIAVAGLGDTPGTLRLDTGNGIALLSQDGQLFYRGTPGFVGVDSFDYVIEDGAGGSDTANVSVIVGAEERGTSLTLGEAQRVAYAYEAALDRDGDIDLPGLNFWIRQRFEGQSERDLAAAFYLSQEFIDSFGEPETLSDRELVEVFFRNVLDREGEEGGIVFWVGALADPAFTREDLLLAFAASPENLLGSPEVTTLEEIEPGEWAFV